MTSDTTEPGPGWHLDEVLSAGRENLDPEHVARYDRKEDAGAAAEAQLCLDLGVTHDSTVVEFGAGTGQFAPALAPRCVMVRPGGHLAARAMLQHCGFRIEEASYSSDGIFAQYLLRRTR